MKDGLTRKLARKPQARPKSEFLERHRAMIVITSGAAAGNELELDRERVSLGRGPGVDMAFEDESMSREHAALELVDEGFRVRDLGSTNGVRVNDAPVLAAELKHGDRLQLGEHTFQYVLERRRREPRAYVLDGER